MCMRTGPLSALAMSAPFIVLADQSSRGQPQAGAGAHGAAVSREEFEQRLAEIERRHQLEIAELREELAARAPDRPPPDDRLTQQRSQEQKRLVDDLLAQIESDAPRTPTLRAPASFNPDFAVVSDFLGTWSGQRANNALNRFDVREVELDLRAAVDPRADAVAVIAFPRDVANDLFPSGEEPEGPEAGVELEEAYLFLHNFGVPNLTAKLGRFHVRFGRQNLLHLHDLPTSDPSFVNQAFLAPEALSDSGFSLSYVVPNPWNQYFEVVAEVLAGEGAGSESPVFTGDLAVDSPAINMHALWNADMGRDWNMELGGSWMHGRRGPDNSTDADLLGGDLTLIHTDPRGNFNNLLLQAEFIHGIVDRDDGSTARSWGAYLLAQQQLNKDWYVGARFDWTQDPNDPSMEALGVSPYLSWYWSEFLRFRIEYQHQWGDVPDQDVVMLQVTWVFGAHPPHPYWVMR